MTETIRTGPAQVAAPVPRSTPPIAVWAVIGGLTVSLTLYALIRWAASGQMQPTYHGPDSMPSWAYGIMWFFQIVGPILTIYMIYRFVIAPWRRAGQLSTDGMLLIAWFAVAIPHDIMMDYTQYTFAYNSNYLNAGSWMSQIPGVILPNAHRIPEPLLLSVPAYGWAVFLASVLGCWMMRRIQARWPSMGKVSVLALTLLAFMVLDFVLEMPLILIKAEFYGATIRQLTLFAGTNHQYPLYELLFWGALWTAASALRYYRDDKGRTLVERGVDGFDMAPGRTTLVRLLAIIGAAASIITVFYNLPWNFAAAQANDFPKDAPSYFLNGVCGPGSSNPCTGPDTPIYRSGKT